MLKTENDVVEREDEHGGDVSVGHGDEKSNNMFNGNIMKEEDEHGRNVGKCCRNKEGDDRVIHGKVRNKGWRN